MSESYSASYAAAGVDITAGYRAVELMKQHVARTMTPGVLEGLGGFGFAFFCFLGKIPMKSLRPRSLSTAFGHFAL